MWRAAERYQHCIVIEGVIRHCAVTVVMDSEHRQAEDKKRAKARQAAIKTGKPLFEEDGVARGLLEKYNEAAPDDGMQIDESGVVADERTARQAQIRAKLAACVLGVLCWIPLV